MKKTFAASEDRFNRASRANGSKIALVILFALILVVGVGPRVSISVIDAEFRIQDVLIFPVIGYLLASKPPSVRSPLRKLFGILLPTFLWTSFFAVIISVMVFPEVPILRRILFYGRSIELIVLAVAISGLYLRSGHFAIRSVSRAVAVGAIVNLAWVGFQLAIGENTTLFNQDFASSVGHYGPMLLGEPSAFGTGQYWVFVSAFAAAQIHVRVNRILNIFLYFGAFVGAWVAESRISVVGILIIGALLLFLGSGNQNIVNPLGILVGAILALFGTFYVFPSFSEGRVSPDAIGRSLEFRINEIWAPFIDDLSKSPFTGLGPGGIGGERYLSEAHNIILRALLDFGILSGLLFISIFVVAVFRGFHFARLREAGRTDKIAGYFCGFFVLSVLVSGQVQDALTAVMPSHLAMVSIGILAAQRAIFHEQICGQPKSRRTPGAEACRK